MIEVGEMAPDFCLPNQDENEICLRDLRGKWVVLYFYPKDNTPGCTAEAIDFTENLPEFEELDAVVLGVSPDSPKKHRNFIEKKGLKITLLSDENKEVLEKYGVWQLKKMCGREYMGVVRTTYLIDPEGKVAARWDKVRVKGHVEKVKEKLKELRGE
ncbi:MAG: thioredoxin-dependent thiol peroxidase [Epsilonproteobacteria bacterium]|nr:thioredoxin-dependent thiol peroxidase [Campylobacterota bacterium]